MKVSMTDIVREAETEISEGDRKRAIHIIRVKLEGICDLKNRIRKEEKDLAALKAMSVSEMLETYRGM
jgi:hypothetical protein